MNIDVTPVWSLNHKLTSHIHRQEQPQCGRTHQRWCLHSSVCYHITHIYPWQRDKPVLTVVWMMQPLWLLLWEHQVVCVLKFLRRKAEPVLTVKISWKRTTGHISNFTHKARCSVTKNALTSEGYVGWLGSFLHLLSVSTPVWHHYRVITFNILLSCSVRVLSVYDVQASIGCHLLNEWWNI